MPTNPYTQNNPYSTSPPARDAVSSPFMREEVLYPWENPDFAFNNALQDVGVNPYSANPFAQATKRLAPSLQQSYLGHQAMNRGNSPYAVANAGAGGADSTPLFSEYLRAGIQGQDLRQKYPTFAGTQGAHNAAASAAGQLPQMAQAVRQYRNDLGAGRINASNLNPYMAAFSERLGANGGLGTADYLSSVMSPFLAPGMASAYRRALYSSGEQAIRRLAGEPLNTPNDIWTYLLGI